MKRDEAPFSTNPYKTLPKIISKTVPLLELFMYISVYSFYISVCYIAEQIRMRKKEVIFLVARTLRP